MDGGKKDYIDTIKSNLTASACQAVTEKSCSSKYMKEGMIDAPDNDEPELSPEEQEQIINTIMRHAADGTNNDEVEAHDEDGKERASYRDIVSEAQKSGGDAAYDAFVKKKLNGRDLGKMSDEETKKFFNQIDKEWKADNEGLSEEKKSDDPCWKGYTQYGMKKKDGKEVPNCIKEELSAKNKAQLEVLRKEASKINRIDPAGPTYKKMKAMVSSMNKDQLRGLALMKIKWFSMLAANELQMKHGERLKFDQYMSEELELLEGYLSKDQRAARALPLPRVSGSERSKRLDDIVNQMMKDAKRIKKSKEDQEKRQQIKEDEILSEEFIAEAANIEKEMADAVKAKEDIDLELDDGTVIDLSWENAKTILSKSTGARVAMAAKNREKFMSFLDSIL